MDAALSALLPSQVFGAEWGWGNLSSVPAVLYGAPAVAYHLQPNSSLTPDHWLRAAQWYASGPTHPPAYVATLAWALTAAWSAFQGRVELVERVVAAVDFYAHQQGVNGGFAAPHPSTAWCGAPHRSGDCGGPADDVGAYALGAAVLHLRPLLDAGGYLDQSVDAELDGRMVPRRQAWAAMFNRSVAGLVSRGVQQCPWEELGRVMGLLAADSAAGVGGGGWPVGLAAVEAAVNGSLGWGGEELRPGYGPAFTATGWVMECRGVEGGGGVDFSHGLEELERLVDLVQLSTNLSLPSSPAYTARAEALATHLLHFAFPALTDDAPYPAPLPHHSLRLPTGLNTRREEGPDGEVPLSLTPCWWLASVRRHPLCLRLLHVQLMQGRWPLPLNTTHWTADLVSVWRQWAYMSSLVDAVGHLYDAERLTTALLPSEVAYLDVVSPSNHSLVLHMAGHSTELDVMASSLQIKYQYERLYINFNRRHSAGEFDGFAVVQWHTPQYSVEATVAMAAPDGFDGLYCLQFAYYHIATNRGTGRNYTYDDLCWRDSEYWQVYPAEEAVVGGVVLDFFTEAGRDKFVLRPQQAVLYFPQVHSVNYGKEVADERPAAMRE